MIDYVNTGAADRFLIVVQNVRGAAQPRNLNIFSFQPECAAAGPALLAPPRHERHNYNTASRSVSRAGRRRRLAGQRRSSVGAICSASASAAGAFPGARPTSRASTRRTRPRSSSAAAARRSTDGIKPDIAGDRRRVDHRRRLVHRAVLRHVGGRAARRRDRRAAAAERAVPAEPGGVDDCPRPARARRCAICWSGRRVPLSPAPDNVFGAGRADAFAAVQPHAADLEGHARR